MKDQFKTIYHYISIIRCRVSKFPRDKILLRAKRFETRHDFIVSFFFVSFDVVVRRRWFYFIFFFFSIYIYFDASFLVLAFFFSSLSIHRLIANFFFFFFEKRTFRRYSFPNEKWYSGYAKIRIDSFFSAL